MKESKFKDAHKYLFPTHDLIYANWWEMILLKFVRPFTVRDVSDETITTITVKRMFGCTYIISVDREPIPRSTYYLNRPDNDHYFKLVSGGMIIFKD